MSIAEDRRLQRLKLTDDHIGRSLRESAASGELQAAPGWGKPMDFGNGNGCDETPAELRMPFKVLEDAGVVPHEVSLMAEAAGLRRAKWRRRPSLPCRRHWGSAWLPSSRPCRCGWNAFASRAACSRRRRRGHVDRRGTATAAAALRCPWPAATPVR
jgi:Domain of unknown function (DUF1992)